MNDSLKVKVNYNQQSVTHNVNSKFVCFKNWKPSSLFVEALIIIFLRTTNSYNLNCLLCVEMILRANVNHNDDDATRIRKQKTFRQVRSSLW